MGGSAPVPARAHWRAARQGAGPEPPRVSAGRRAGGDQRGNPPACGAHFWPRRRRLGTVAAGAGERPALGEKLGSERALLVLQGYNNRLSQTVLFA